MAEKRKRGSRKINLTARLGRQRADAVQAIIGERRWELLQKAWTKRRIESVEKIRRRQEAKIKEAAEVAGLTKEETSRLRGRLKGGNWHPERVVAFPFKRKDGTRKWQVQIGTKVMKRGLSGQAKERLVRRLKQEDDIRRLKKELDMTRPEVLKLKRAIAQAAKVQVKKERAKLTKEIVKAKDPAERRRLKRRLKKINVAKRVRGAQYALRMLARVLESE